MEKEMQININLETLKRNIIHSLKIEIEDDIYSLVNKSTKEKTETFLVEKINSVLDEKVNQYFDKVVDNLTVSIDDVEMKIEDYLKVWLINQAEEKSKEVGEKINDLFEDMKSNLYSKHVKEDFNEDELKVKFNTIERDDDWYGHTVSYEIYFNGQRRLHIGQGEPEDMTLYRDLSDVFNVESMIIEAYNAGKANKILYIANETSDKESEE